MSEVADRVDTNFRRVGMADLTTLLPLVTKRLQERRPHVQLGAVLGWLRGCVLSNEMWFVMSEQAVALAQIMREPLEQQPFAIEHFVFVRPLPGTSAAAVDAVDEAAGLYVPMCKWAANMNCSRLEVDRNTDVPRTDIRMRVGKVGTKTVAHISLGRVDQ